MIVDGKISRGFLEKIVGVFVIRKYLSGMRRD